MTKTKKQKIVVIVGPTCSGKTSLSIKLAKRFKGEVISADSRQVYKGLNVGTGKVTKKEMGNVLHHLLDVVSPKKVYTAHDFTRDGRKAIDEIVARQKLPIVAGGTGFYIDALVGLVSLADVPPNPSLRKKLEKKTALELFALLLKKDLARAESIDKDNPVRLIRALEIADALGKNPAPVSAPLYDILWIGISPFKESLKKNIHDRLLARIKQGMVREAKKLHKGGLSHKRMEALGLEYRYLSRLLRKQITKKQFLVELEQEINLFAKRQMTYWKRNKNIEWLEPREMKNFDKKIRLFLNQ